jgi:hypothetical protein
MRNECLNVFLPGANYVGAPQMKAFYGEVLERIRSLPGVSWAGCANAMPGGILPGRGLCRRRTSGSETSWASKVAAFDVSRNDFIFC